MCAAPLNTRYRREERSSTQTTQTNVLVAHIGVLGHCTTWLGESVALAAINDGLGPLRRRPVLCTEEISFAEHPKSHTVPTVSLLEDCQRSTVQRVAQPHTECSAPPPHKPDKADGGARGPGPARPTRLIKRSPATMGCGASSLSGGSESSSRSAHNSPRSGLSLQRTWIVGQLSMTMRNAHVEEKHVASVTPVSLTRPPRLPMPPKFLKLLESHGRFLVNFVAVLERSAEHAESRKQITKLNIKPMQRPQMDQYHVKSHWMDNVRVRKVCDEMLHLEDQSHPLPENGKANSMKGLRNSAFMSTLQLSIGQQVNVLKMSNNPGVTIGGYFIVSQMLSYIKSLVSLDLSSNNLSAAEARVLSLGLKSNHSVQELRMKDNTVGSEGATSMADMLKVNDSLLLLDLRMNSIRGAGVCALADAMSENKSLTELDMRWNYAGECADFVEMALLDLNDFCFRNMMAAIEKEGNRSSDQIHSEASAESNISGVASSPLPPEQTSEVAERFYKSPDFFVDQESIGRLEITILSAHNLPQVLWTSGKDGEFMGLPQSYCTFTLNKQTTSTAITKKDWAPKWNHTVSMDVRQVWQVCSLKVMHSKSLARTHIDDYTIGNVNLPVGAVVNWRGVSLGSDHTWRAYHRQMGTGRGKYTPCKLKLDENDQEVDIFETAEQAARAYDETARRKDSDKAVLNLSSEYDEVGQHMKDEVYPLTGDDGVGVIGVQAGVQSAVRLRLKFFSNCCHYLEIKLDKATCLPKMDAGLGTCDAYCIIRIGEYHFRSKVVRNALDPEFQQTFRIAIQDIKMQLEMEVQIWDWDRYNEDDFMGFSKHTIDTEHVKSDPAKTIEKDIMSAENHTVPLLNGKRETSRLHLRFQLTMAEHAEHDENK